MLLPGGRGIEAADRWVVEEAWGGPLPSRPGRDSAGILEAAARHDVRVLFLAGVDPLTDFPDAALARRALENVAHKVVLEVASDNLRIYADAMLPAAAFVEKDGHYTDWEGRAQRIRSVRAPQGLARSDWEIFQKLSEVMGKDMGFHSLKDLHVEMGRLLAPHGVAPVDVRTPPRSPSARLGGGPPAYAAPPLPETEQATGNEALPDHQLLLFTYPLLVDEGTMSVGADELKAALEEPPFLELNHADAEQLDISDGDMVRIRTAAGEALLPARVTDGIAPGSVFVPYNQPGFAANGILSGRRVTAVTIERAQAAQEVASA